MPDDDEALREELCELRASVADLERRVRDLEVADQDSSTPNTETGTRTEREEAAATDSGAEFDRTSHATQDGTSSVSFPDIEFEVGIKALGLAGGAALIFATLFLVQLAIERGYLGPLGRVTVGTSVGVMMYGGGRYVTGKRGLSRWGRLVSGTGFVIAYVAMYAMTGFEGYREAIGAPVWASLVGIALLVVGIVGDSLRRRDVVVAGGAVVLGYVAVLFTLEDVTATVSAGYIIGLTAVLAGSVVVHSPKPVLVAGVGAGYLSAFWWTSVRDVGPGWLDIGVSAAVFGLFLLGVELLRREDPPVTKTTDEVTLQSVGLTGVASGLNGICGMGLVGVSVGGVYGSDTATAVAVSTVGVTLLGIHLVATEIRHRNAAVEPFLVFLALGVAVGLVADDVTRVLALVGGAALVLGSARRLTSQWLRVAGQAVTVVLFVDALRIVYVGGSVEYLPVTATTARAGMYAVLVGFYYVLFLVETREGVSEGPVLPVLREYNTVMYSWAGSVLLALFFEIVLDGVALSVAWAVLGFLVIATGVVFGMRQFSLQGLSLLGITTLKVFLVDTSGLDPVPRILSFVVLGVVLLTTAFLYARIRTGPESFGFSGDTK